MPGTAAARSSPTFSWLLLVVRDVQLGASGSDITTPASSVGFLSKAPACYCGRHHGASRRGARRHDTIYQPTDRPGPRSATRVAEAGPLLRAVRAAGERGRRRTRAPS